MKKFLVTYDLKVQYMNLASPVHTRGDSIPWGPEYSSHYAFIEAEDQDSAIEQFLTTYNSDRCKVVKMMICDLNHVYKVPL